MNTKSTWTTREGVELNISDMTTSHIENCIRLIDKKTPELDENDEYLSADGDGLTGVLVIPGARHYREKRKLLVKELNERGKTVKEPCEHCGEVPEPNFGLCGCDDGRWG